MSTTVKLPISPRDQEHVRARHWREHIMRLSKVQLAAVSGFSVSSITDFEAGTVRARGTPVDPDTMARYRLVCAALAAHLEFDWITCRATVTRVETVDLMPDRAE